MSKTLLREMEREIAFSDFFRNRKNKLNLVSPERIKKYFQENDNRYHYINQNEDDINLTVDFIMFSVEMYLSKNN